MNGHDQVVPLQAMMFPNRTEVNPDVAGCGHPKMVFKESSFAPLARLEVCLLSSTTYEPRELCVGVVGVFSAPSRVCELLWLRPLKTPVSTACARLGGHTRMLLGFLLQRTAKLSS